MTIKHANYFAEEPIDFTVAVIKSDSTIFIEQDLKSEVVGQPNSIKFTVN